MNIKKDLTNAKEIESADAKPGTSADHSIEGDASPAVRATAGQSLDWLVVCDHASNCVPPRFGGLGVSFEALQEHIAWDIGAARVARRLSLRLGAPLIESACSRLLIDCNRYPDVAESIVTMSDRRVIHGNQDITPAQRLERRSAFFRPYHLAIDAALCEAERSGHTPVFISVHTCTASLNGRSRPWDIGISWSRDERVAGPLLERLAGMQGITVGDNQPYSLEIGEDFTTPEHAMVRGLAHLQLELRQDLLRTAEAADWWADQLYERISEAHSRATWNRRHHVLTSADNIHGIGKWL